MFFYERGFVPAVLFDTLQVMNIKEQLDKDLKSAMLAGDKTLATTIRGLKSVILYAEVAANVRDAGLPNDEVVGLFAKEAKKRQESADLFAQGGNQEKAAAELAEKRVIEQYLPTQLSDVELATVIDQIVGDTVLTNADMGRVIGQVKAKVGASVDGGRIAKAVQQRIGA